MTAKRSISVYHLQWGRSSGRRKTYLREHGLGSFRDPTIALHVPVGKQKGGKQKWRKQKWRWSVRCQFATHNCEFNTNNCFTK